MNSNFKSGTRRMAIPISAGITLGIVLGAAMGNVGLGLAAGILTGGAGMIITRMLSKASR